MPIVCLNFLIQVHQGYPYAWVGVGLSLALLFAHYGMQKERDRRYPDAVVLMCLFGRDHPEEFHAIQMDQSKFEANSISSIVSSLQVCPSFRHPERSMQKTCHAGQPSAVRE